MGSSYGQNRIEESLRMLMASGGDHQWSEPGRLLDEPREFSGFHSPSLGDIHAALSGARPGRRELQATLTRIAQVCEVAHCTVHRVRLCPGTVLRRQIQTTYPARWIILYAMRNYQRVDPVLRICTSWRRPFFWDEIDADTAEERAFLSVAEQFGIGPSGYTHISPVEDGSLIAVSLCCAAPAETFRPRIEALQADFGRVAEALANAFFELNAVRKGALAFTKAEISYLVGILNGQTQPPQSDDEDRDENGARAMERSITAKMNCVSFHQALLLIGRSGHLEDPEFVLESLVR